MGWRAWTGVGERRWKTAPNEQVQPSKTLWDWLQLLIVPVILVGVTSDIRGADFTGAEGADLPPDKAIP